MLEKPLNQNDGGPGGLMETFKKVGQAIEYFKQHHEGGARMPAHGGSRQKQGCLRCLSQVRRSGAGGRRIRQPDDRN